MKIKNFDKIFKFYCNHPNLKGTFADCFYSGYILNNDKSLNDNQVLISYKVPPQICNFSGAVHGGAYATMIDTCTTLAIMKLDKTLRKTVTI